MSLPACVEIKTIELQKYTGQSKGEHSKYQLMGAIRKLRTVRNNHES